MMPYVHNCYIHYIFLQLFSPLCAHDHNLPPCGLWLLPLEYAGPGYPPNYSTEGPITMQESCSFNCRISLNTGSKKGALEGDYCRDFCFKNGINSPPLVSDCNRMKGLGLPSQPVCLTANDMCVNSHREPTVQCGASILVWRWLWLFLLLLALVFKNVIWMGLKSIQNL